MRLLPKILPRNVRLATVTDCRLDQTPAELNKRLRKSLDWMTRAEKLDRLQQIPSETDCT